MQSLDNDELKRRLAAFLTTKIPSARVTGELTRYPVGFSWLTYGFEAEWEDKGWARHDLILRLGPPQGIFAPYSAREQFIALKALENSGVPVPKVYWYSDDLELLGGAFFIMERMPGEAPLPWVTSGEGAFDEPTRERLAENFVGALAKLHAFDWTRSEARELSEPVTPEGTAMRQVLAYENTLRHKQLRSYPILEDALLWLKANAPVAPRISIVHGDYRIGNFLVEDNRISAILDWELVHLGDPHEDLGWMCMRPFRGRSPLMCHLVTRDRLYQRYQEISGIPVDPKTVHFYELFGNFKLAVIHVCAVRAFEDGGWDDLRMPAMGAQIPRMLLQVQRSMEEQA